MKLLTGLTIVAMLLLFGCGDSGSSSSDTTKKAPTEKKAAPADDGKGVGEIKSVTLNDPLKPDMVESGKGVYEMKCAACHKLSAMRVVGPGWAGITEKRKPEWIMNMIMNVDVMLEEDPAARKMLEECLVRMPNQNLTVDDSRNILEFMYANDKEVAAAN